jgi:predicted porin
MKKSLLAVAAMGAFASAAQAQSSVTIYGIMDVGYISQSVRNAGTIGTTGANSTGLGNAGYGVGANKSSGFGSSAETTSRFGFRGTEDLGGGANAFFTVEIGLQSAAAAALQANNRQAFLGLGKKGLGTVAIGTQYTPTHEAVGATDPGQQNNMPGNIIYPADASVNSNPTAASYGGFAAPNASNAATQGGPGTGNTGYVVRTSNALKFVSDRVAGVQAKLMYTSMGNTTNESSVNNGTTTITGGGTVSTSGYMASLDYTIQKFQAIGAYTTLTQKTSAQTVTNSTGVSSLAQTQSGTTFSGVNTDETSYYFGGTYDFGILKAYAQYINRKMAADNNSNLYTKRTGQQIGVRSYITPTIEAWASGGTGKITNAYYATSGTLTSVNTVGATMTGYQLGANYWLSKRTNLYGIFGIERTGNAVYPTTSSGATTTNNAVSNSINAYAVGVRHTF